MFSLECPSRAYERKGLDAHPAICMCHVRAIREALCWLHVRPIVQTHLGKTG